MTTSRDASGSPASGSSRPLGTGVDAFRAGPPARPVAGDAHRPVRPEPVPLAGRGPGRRLRPARLDAAEDRAPARPVQPVRARRRPARARGRRAWCPAPPAPPTRSGSGSTSARRSAASPTPRSSTSATSSSGIRQVAPNLALAVFGGAAPANLGIALDVRGPILSTANSCASGAVALGEALGDLREGRVDAAIAGGCEIPLSPLAFGAFDIIRALSAGHNDDPGHGRPAVRCGSRRLRHGRGRRAARARGRRGRRATRRDPVRRAARLRRDVGRPSHGPAARRRPRGRAGRDDRAGGRRRRARPRSTT